MDSAPTGFTHIRHHSPLPALHDGHELAGHRVVIAGGGPVGLAVALGLARHGIASLVIEAGDTVCAGSRAICLSRRTLEILDRLGVLDAFLRKGLPWTGGRSYYREAEVLHFRMPHDADQRLAPMTNLQQYYIEQFLLDAVLQQPGLIELRWQTRITGLTQDEAGATVALETDGAAYYTAADYVVACDGARSAIRQALGLRMSGTAYEGRYVIADIEIDLDLPTERLAWFDPPSAPGRTMLMHKQPDDLWRVDYQLHADEDSDAMVQPQAVAAVVNAHLRMMGVDRPWRMVWISMYRAAALSLDRYRHGRVLLAGDAAHLVPIFGVRGLNGGFDDAYNLAWKLAYALDGTAPPALLDSFSAERRAGWEYNIANAMKSTEFMAPPSRGFEVMRTAVLSLARSHPALAALISPRQSSSIFYEQSALNTADDTPGDFTAGPPPGQILPEAPMADGGGKTFLTRLLSDDFTLLAFYPGGEPPAWLTALAAVCQDAGAPVALVAIRPPGSAAPGDATVRDVVDQAGRAAALLDAAPGAAYLIRPDGHVCARWRKPDPQSLRRAVQTALGAAQAA